MPRIVIIGAGLSGLCTAFYLIRALDAGEKNAEIMILESKSEPGGKLRTIRQNGFNIECGPNGFLTNKPFGMDLVKDLEIEDHLVYSFDEARKRYIFSKGKLQRLPETPVAFFLSGLLSPLGRLRICWEPFAASPPPSHIDESVGDFARRRLGKEALEKLIEPMVTGIYAGNPDHMSLRHSFPMIQNLENKYGGLVRGMISLKIERARQGIKMEMSAGPGGVLVSFDKGVQTLTDELVSRLSDGLHLNASVDRIERRDGRYILHLSEKDMGEEIEADIVALATPAYDAKKLLLPMDEELAAALDLIPYSPISVVALGYETKSLGNPLDGFGFLIPRGEKRNILGALWDSSVFPNRAPKDNALIRVMIGGARAPKLASLPEVELLALIRKELQDTMGISTRPMFTRAFLHDKGIPQYLVGHGKVLERINTRLSHYPGLFLNSNAYRGIGLNDCVRESKIVAVKIAKLI
ncbi:MAG: protoporphyrinogen oxidase [Syntrophorhabdaceae bacterium]|nr:protoporphyrinogen oxidase [Syntrophorhabdaceae bacterium]